MYHGKHDEFTGVCWNTKSTKSLGFMFVPKNSIFSDYGEM